MDRAELPTLLGKELITITSRNPINLDLIEFYIESGAKLDVVVSGKTALWSSAGNTDACRMILAAMKNQEIHLDIAGADNPLIPALTNLEALKLLIDAGVDSKKYQDNPLIPAIDTENRGAFDLLVAANVDPNIFSEEPPLYVAMRTRKDVGSGGGRERVYMDLSHYRKTLLESGAKTTALNKKGVPLICVQRSRFDGSDDDYDWEHNGNYLGEFLRYTKEEDLAAALQINGQPMLCALRNGDYALTERFLRLGVDPYSLANGLRICVEIIFSGDTKEGEGQQVFQLAELLLGFGANPRYAEAKLRNFRADHAELGEDMARLYRSMLAKMPEAQDRLPSFFKLFEYGVEKTDEGKARMIMEGVNLATIGSELSERLGKFIKKSLVATYAHDEQRTRALEILFDAGLGSNPEYNPSELLAAHFKAGISSAMVSFLLKSGASATEEMIDSFIKDPRREPDLGIVKLLLDKYADSEKPNFQKYVNLAEQCGSSRYIERATAAGITAELIDSYIKSGDRSAKICQSMLNGYSGQENPNMRKYASAAVKYGAMEFIDRAMAMPEMAGLILDAIMGDRHDRPSLSTEIKKALLDRYATSEKPDLGKYIGLAMQNGSVVYLQRSAETDTKNFYQPGATQIVHWAAQHGHHDLIRTLGSGGFPMNRADRDGGNTPLVHAITRETAELLLSFRPDLLTTLNDNGEPPRIVIQTSRGVNDEVRQYLMGLELQPSRAAGNPHNNPAEAWRQDSLCIQMTNLALRCGGNPESSFTSFVPGHYEQQPLTLTFTGQYAKELASALATIIAPRCNEAVQLKINDREVKLSFTAPDNGSDRAMITNILINPELLDNIEARMQAAQKSGGGREAVFFPLLDSLAKIGFLSYKPLSTSEHYDVKVSRVIANINNSRRDQPANIVSFCPDNQEAVTKINETVPIIAKG